MGAQIPYVKWHSTVGPPYPQVWHPQMERAGDCPGCSSDASPAGGALQEGAGSRADGPRDSPEVGRGG